CSCKKLRVTTTRMLGAEVLWRGSRFRQMMRRSARHGAVTAIATTNAVRYVKKLGRLLWQQAAPFYSSCLLLPVESSVSVFSLRIAILVAVCSVGRSRTDTHETLQDRRGGPTHDHAQD